MGVTLINKKSVSKRMTEKEYVVAGVNEILKIVEEKSHLPLKRSQKQEIEKMIVWFDTLKSYCSTVEDYLDALRVQSYTACVLVVNSNSHTRRKGFTFRQQLKKVKISEDEFTRKKAIIDITKSFIALI